MLENSESPKTEEPSPGSLIRNPVSFSACVSATYDGRFQNVYAVPYTQDRIQG